MLPPGSRLRAAADFESAMRRGVKSGRGTVVVHLGQDLAGRKAGFIVSRAVGAAVVRNRVKRRLRAIARAELVALPEGTRLVVRALPAAATATFDRLARDVSSAVGSARAKAGRG